VERWVESGDVTLFYEVFGAGSPLFLLHPGLCDGSLWSTLGYRAALEESFRLIVPDLRGHGRSSAPHDDAAYSADAMRDDLGAILDAEGYHHAAVWGFSLGALLAIRFAAAYPDRLTRLAAGGAVGWLPRREVGTESADRIERRGLASVAPPDDGDPAALPLRPVIMNGDPVAHAARYRAQAAWDPPQGLHELSIPVLLYGGSADSFTPAVRDLATTLPDARLAVVPGMGHLQLWCHPEAMLDCVREFLAGDADGA
jgi:pimeloyl-ACP methyl ester carboxylesterase